MDIKSVACCFLLAVGSAHAEGVYVLGSVGQSHFSNSLSDTVLGYTIDNDFGTTVTSSKIDKNDSAYKFQIGYKFFENFAIEAGYINLGEQKITVGLDAPANFITGSGHGSMKVSGINADAVLLLPINAGFSMFFKLGVLDAKTKGSYDASATYSFGGFTDSFSESDSSSVKKRSANFGGGMAYNFYKGASVRLELEQFNNVGDKHKTGTANIQLASLGLSYEF